MANKITGYLLIAIGIILIVASVMSVVSVFNHRAEPIHIFSTETFAPAPSQASEAFNLQQMVGLTPETISYTFNLFMHLVLMGFLVNAGARVAHIGAQLVRPIVVEYPKAEAKKDKEK
jgi:hypothetical protein